ncbi:unnamed protein product, partial [Protopolystoma xenopodis]
DERNEVITSNIWLEQEWSDNNLRWDPNDYNGTTQIYVPSQMIWKPDIVLFNNADGKYEITVMTKATVYHDGQVIWIPPAIYKSSCQIDVEFFPYDEQVCSMKFGSWTYDGGKVDLKHITEKYANGPSGMVEIDYAVDMRGFSSSVEFDILSVTGVREEHYPAWANVHYPDVTFRIRMRRKTLFFTVNLMMPCVTISFLTVLVFYLPSESGEKISLSISILVSLTLFFLLLAEIIPATNLVVPLIGKYLLFTIILVSLSIIVTVIVLNLHHRASEAQNMSGWLRVVFLGILPKILLMTPARESDESNDEEKQRKSTREDLRVEQISEENGGQNIPSLAQSTNSGKENIECRIGSVVKRTGRVPSSAHPLKRDRKKICSEEEVMPAKNHVHSYPWKLERDEDIKTMGELISNRQKRIKIQNEQVRK